MIIKSIRLATNDINDIHLVVKTGLNLYFKSNSFISKFIPAEKFETNIYLRIKSNIFKPKESMVKNEIESKLAYKIIKDLVIYGDGTMKGITFSINREYSVNIHFKTIEVYLRKLQSKGWLSTYKLITGKIGSRPKYYYLSNYGTHFISQSNKF